MAVLVEAISVIVRRDSVGERFPGGWGGFVDFVPNSTLCFDDDIARVGFMTPTDVGIFIKHLEGGGLTFLRNGQAIDMAVVEQLRGPTTPVNWLQYAEVSFDSSDKKVSACWMVNGPGMSSVGIRMPINGKTLSVPNEWEYENSLSANRIYVESKDLQSKMKFIRHQDGLDVYMDQSTGKEVFVGRPKV